MHMKVCILFLASDLTVTPIPPGLSDSLYIMLHVIVHMLCD